MQQPNNNEFQRHWPPMQQMPQAPSPKRRRRFRWELFVGLPLLLLALIWIYNSIEIGFSWDELLDKWDIADKPRFTALAILGVLACCVCAIARVLRSKEGEE